MSGYCRVTVTGPDKWADLALPGTVSVATLMPQVVRVCSPDPEGLQAAAWSLARVDGTPLASGGSLHDAGILDGDVLLLRKEAAPERPTFVDDVRGAVEDRVDETAWLWRPSTTLGLGLTLATLGPLLLAVVMAAIRTAPVDLAVAPMGLLISLGALWVAERRSLPGTAHALQAAACGWGALTAVLAVPAMGSAPPAPVALGLFACAGALVASAVGWALDNAMLPYLAGLSVLTGATGALVAVGLFVDGPLALRLLAVLLVLGVGVLPRAALALGGLSGLDYEVRQVGRTDTERFETSLAAGDRLLLGSLLGMVAAAVASVALLAFTGSGSRDWLLAALVSTVLLLRSRLFDRVVHVLPVRLGGVLGLVVTAAVASTGLGGGSALLPALGLLAGTAVGALSMVHLTDVPRASIRRLFNAMEVVAVIAMCVAAVWALGVYEAVTSINLPF